MDFWTIFAAVMGALLWSVDDSQAQFADGNRLHVECNKNIAGAAGYIIGASDGIEVGRIAAGDEGRTNNVKICVPIGVTGSQALHVVCSYLAKNPSERHWPAAAIVNNALADVWPCRSAAK